MSSPAAPESTRQEDALRAYSLERIAKALTALGSEKSEIETDIARYKGELLRRMVELKAKKLPLAGYEIALEEKVEYAHTPDLAHEFAAACTTLGVPVEEIRQAVTIETKEVVTAKHGSWVALAKRYGGALTEILKKVKATPGRPTVKCKPTATKLPRVAR